MTLMSIAHAMQRSTQGWHAMHDLKDDRQRSALPSPFKSELQKEARAGRPRGTDHWNDGMRFSKVVDFEDNVTVSKHMARSNTIPKAHHQE